MFWKGEKVEVLVESYEVTSPEHSLNVLSNGASLPATGIYKIQQ